MRSIGFLFCFIFLGLTPFPVKSENYGQFVKATAELLPQKEKGEYLLRVQGIIASGKHLYSASMPTDSYPIPTKIELSGENWEPIGHTEESESQQIIDEVYQTILPVQKDHFYFLRSYKTKKILQKNELIVVFLHFQICDQKICSLPVEKKISFPWRDH